MPRQNSCRKELRRSTSGCRSTRSSEEAVCHGNSQPHRRGDEHRSKSPCSSRSLKSTRSSPCSSRSLKSTRSSRSPCNSSRSLKSTQSSRVHSNSPRRRSHDEVLCRDTTQHRRRGNSPPCSIQHPEKDKKLLQQREDLISEAILQQQKKALRPSPRRGSYGDDDLFTMFQFSHQVIADKKHLEFEREEFAKMQRRESMKKRQPLSTENLFKELQPSPAQEEQICEEQPGRRRSTLFRRLSASMAFFPEKKAPTGTRKIPHRSRSDGAVTTRKSWYYSFD